jgi:hypothetical protein
VFLHAHFKPDVRTFASKAAAEEVMLLLEIKIAK